MNFQQLCDAVRGEQMAKSLPNKQEPVEYGEVIRAPMGRLDFNDPPAMAKAITAVLGSGNSKPIDHAQIKAAHEDGKAQGRASDPQSKPEAKRERALNDTAIAPEARALFLNRSGRSVNVHHADGRMLTPDQARAACLKAVAEERMTVDEASKVEHHLNNRRTMPRELAGKLFEAHAK
jgi:hypothetical protein